MLFCVCMKVKKRIEISRARTRLLTEIRRFFENKQHLEIETPVLSPVKIPESHIELFSTCYKAGTSGDRMLCLVPSPEVWMKRLLAEGFPSCFQVTRSFRNAEQLGRLHNPEFTMLEWYTIGAGYMNSLQITQELLQAVGFNGTALPESSSASVLSMRELFLRYTGIDIKHCPGMKDLRETAREKGYEMECSTWEECFHKIFIGHVEPCLADIPILFIYNYPRQISCLAKNLQDTPYKERWELYIRGIEIANCYTELRDPVEVTRFLEEEMAASEQSGDNVPYDINLAEISSRMPACSGVALGIDRLLMAVTGAATIDEVLLFSPAGSDA